MPSIVDDTGALEQHRSRVDAPLRMEVDERREHM
jgi:hypothetical protein